MNLRFLIICNDESINGNLDSNKQLLWNADLFSVLKLWTRNMRCLCPGEWGRESLCVCVWRSVCDIAWHKKEWKTEQFTLNHFCPVCSCVGCIRLFCAMWAHTTSYDVFSRYLHISLGAWCVFLWFVSFFSSSRGLVVLFVASFTRFKLSEYKKARDSKTEKCWR